MVRRTILEKAGDRIIVATDEIGTFVQTSTGNRSLGSDRHQEVVDDYVQQGWQIVSEQ